MKQEIEQIIKKNLPEKDWIKNWDFHQKGCGFRKRGKWVIFPCDMNCKNVLDNFTQINTSLIADEVLKVVVEKIQEDIKKIGDSDIKKVGRELWGVFDFSGIDNDRGERLHEIIGKMLISSHNSALNNLLSNLSPNKENKNNG